MKIKIVKRPQHSAFPFGHLSSTNIDFLMRMLGEVVDVEIYNKNYYVTDAGFLVHIFNAEVVEEEIKEDGVEPPVKQPAQSRRADLYRLYAEVVAICDAHNYRHTYKCIRYAGKALTRAPVFDAVGEYTFAIGLLEGEPLFVGDYLYHNRKKVKVTGVLSLNGTLTIKCEDTVDFGFGSKPIVISLVVDPTQLTRIAPAERIKVGSFSFTKPVINIPLADNSSIVLNEKSYNWKTEEDKIEALKVIQALLEGNIGK